ncbi:Peroxiredoxin-2C [Acorus calamus]|uniref:glutaredoxin-dependent peroxiredoxin n=1 Tax=Acorus calamus TaxID=4465 RepID=A0AAV9DR81_ACOCL|nr:Peroxiredoxin-2C [Acorus calamus]
MAPISVGEKTSWRASPFTHSPPARRLSSSASPAPSPPPAVNDPFVMKAWAKSYPENEHVKFLADGSGTYTYALGLELDLSDKGLGVRSRRFALLVDDLVVKVANIEEGGEFTVSGADEILSAL